MTADVPEEAEALLSGGPHIAHLATAHDNKPHVAPLWYNYHDGTIEIATTGRKLINVRNNPRVALSIQEDVDGDPQWGVTIRGTATEIEDEDESRATLTRINRRYGASDDAWSENTCFRIEIGSLDYWTY